MIARVWRTGLDETRADEYERFAAEALDRAANYRDTVAAIEATGFLGAPQSVEILPVERAWIAPDLACHQ